MKLTTVTKTIYITNIFYVWAVLLAKDSILLLYYRIFVTDNFRLMVKWSLGFMIVWHFVALMVTTLTCIPIKKNWNFQLQTGYCINREPYYYAASAINIVTDFWVLLLPVSIVLKLNIKLRQKIMLCFLFGLGFM